MIFTSSIAALAMLAAFFGSAGPAGAAPLKLDPKLLARGKEVFARECIVCHGPEGKGDGEAAYLLYPRPRDFTSKVFKIRSTFTGEAPLRSDIVRTLTLGLPGSTMPSFVSLPESDRRALAEYVLSLAGFEEAPGEVVEIPKIPPVSEKWIAKGKAAFEKYECAKCHGKSGRGDGPSASTLKDHKEHPIRPNNFTRGVFKGGGDLRSIATRIMTGIEGTPMPSHADVVEPEDLIALAHHVRQLSHGRDFWQPGTGVIPARRVQGQVPLQPNDPRWAKAVPTAVPLMQLYNDGRPPVEVTVQALHDERRIAVRIEWADSTPDRRILTTRSNGDAAAIQFSIREADPPLFVMGAPENLVNIWYWNASNRGGTEDVEAKYPGMAVDDYPFAGKVYPRRRMGHSRVATARATEKLFVAAWAAKNPNSAPGLLRSAMDLNAGGFGTLTPQPAREQNLRSAERWWKGRWRVVFARDLESPDPNDAQLLPATIHPMAFAIWDGSRGDRNGQKSVSTWYKIRIE